MLIKFSRMFFVCIVILFFVCPIFAQGTGSGTGTGSGSGTSTGSSGGYSSGSSGLSSSSSSSSGSSTTSEIVSPLGDIEFQGFATERSNFVGIDSSVKFVGVDEIFDTSNASSASSARRTTTSSTNRATTRSTTTRRTGTAGRTSQSSNSITNAGRAIASTAAFEPEDSKLYSDKQNNLALRQTEIKTRILRLPNLKLDAEKFNISVVGTSSGVVAELTGVVRTEREGKILKQLLLLEPGIDRVKNELKIEPAVN